jgi:hypothetical protein
MVPQRRRAFSDRGSPVRYLASSMDRAITSRRGILGGAQCITGGCRPPDSQSLSQRQAAEFNLRPFTAGVGEG